MEDTPKKKTTSKNEDRLQLLKSRLEIGKTWAKKPHKGWKEWIDEYNIEDFGDTDEIRDKVRIGYVFRKIESELPAIFDDQPELFIKGRHANTKDIEPLIEGLYDYLWDVQHLDEKIEDAATYFSLLGMGFISSPWVTKTKQVVEMVPQPVMDPMTGQPVVDPNTGQPAMEEVEQMMEVPIVDNPVAKVENPFKVYFSPETIFAPVLDNEHCPYYFVERTATKEEIKARFGKEVDASETVRMNDTDTDDVVQEHTEKGSEVVKSDLQRVTYYEYYGSLSEETAKGIKNAGAWEYDKEYHVFLTKKEELLAEECPYDTKPLFVLGNYGLANKFWKYGTAKHLMPLIQELEMYRSQILEHTRKIANPKLLIPTEADVDEKAITDPRPGVVAKYANQVAPSFLSPAQLGSEVGAGIEQVRQDLEKESGSFDLDSGSGQSTVKTPRGIQVYSEAADKNVRRKRKKIARVIRELLIFQFKQVAKLWKPEDGKTISIVDGGQTQNVQVTEQVLQVLDGVNMMYNLDIEVESLSVNRIQMKQDSLALLDLAIANPTIFNASEIAKWTLQTGFNMRDGDRFLITEEQRQAMMKPQPEQPKVSVSIKADAATPPGAALLSQEGLLPAEIAQQAVIDNQVMEQEVAQIQGAQQQQQAVEGHEMEKDKMNLQGDQAQAQTMTANAFKGGPSQE